jgi:hypothetical protein
MPYLYAMLVGGSVGTATWLIADEFQRRSRARRPDSVEPTALGERSDLPALSDEEIDGLKVAKRAGGYPSR